MIRRIQIQISRIPDSLSPGQPSRISNLEYRNMEDCMRVRPGIEVLLDKRKELVRGARVGAVVHPASVLPDLRHTADALSADGDFQLIGSFRPAARRSRREAGQHGGVRVLSGSGYRTSRCTACMERHGSPTEEMLKDIDVLLFDLQDAGTRVYTFIYTMAYCMASLRPLE